MPEYDKPFGIFSNRNQYVGNVVADPQIVDDGAGNKTAYFSLETYVPLQNAAGQWNDVRIDVPIVVMDPNKVGMIEKYVQAKRQLLIEGYYMSWDDGAGGLAHGTVATVIKLGSKNDYNKTG